MAKPTNRQKLIDYALRALGAPVIEINVQCEQLEDRVDEALQFYQEYHSDGVTKIFRKHLVTATDVTNGYIELPDDLLFVTGILPITNSPSGMFDIKYQMWMSDVLNLGNRRSSDSTMTMASYEIAQQYLSLVQMKLNGQAQRTTFTRHKNRISINGEELIEGTYIVVEGYETIDPDAYPDVYNDIFLKRYLIALIKKQWGTNLKLFTGIQMIGGVEFNGQQIYDEANEELLKVEEEMQLRYSSPIDFFVG